VRSLPVGGTYAVQQSINLPDNLNGAYYLYVKTNASGALYEAESGLQNNVLQSNAQVQYLLPDLAPIECKVLDTGLVSGGIVTLQWKVKNQGAGGLYNKTWGDEIFLSSSPVFSAQKDTLLGGNLQTTNLLSDSSYIVQKQFVLKEGIAGTYYFHLLANYNNAVNESNTGNNSSSSQPVNIKLAPWADLQVTSVTVPQSIGAGQQLLINWTAKNKGSAKIAGAQWIDKVYLSQKPALDINSALLISSVSLRDSIAVNGAYAKSTVYSIPTTTSGFYYAYVFTNADGAVYEFTDSANNIARSSGFTITPYPGADIAILSVNASDSISSGKSLLVKWSVKNISTARTLSDSWNDRIYLTKDSVLNTANLAALPFTFQHNGSLDSGAVYTNQVSFTVPNGIQGKYYIFVQSDYENKLNDLNVANNISGKKIIVQLTPSCDLRIASFSAPQYLTVGQPFTAGWKVINSGNGITPVNSWIDGLYLSQDSVISNNAIELGFFQRAQTLPKDSAYLTGDLSFTVPNNIEGGSYYLLAKTDSRNEVFEMNSKDNNVVVQPVYITVPPPADLLVTTINNPGTAVAGEQASVTWTLRNVGANPAVGYIEDAVYFSQDSTLTASAALMGIDSRYINLQPGSGLKVSRKIDLSKKIKTDSLGNVIGSMPGLAEGSYYVFVKTNIQASLPESSFLNNTGKSSGQTKISARTLTLGVPFTVGMQNMARKYYKVDVPANQDLRIQISGDQSAAANELYVAYNRAPDVNDYDFVSRTPYEPGQSLLVPSTSSGSYYIMAYAANVPVDTEHVTILASALPFTVLSSDQSQGGINGNVTIHLTGAGFRDSMTVYLSDGANLKYPLQLLERLSSTELYARADLHNKAKGIYDIVVVKADNTTAVLAKAFTVTSAQVSANISTDGPGTMRVRNTLSINAFVQNTGNVDLDYPFLAFTTNKSSVTISRIFNDRDSLIFSAADSLSGYLPVILEHTIPVGMTIRYRVELAAGATTDKVQVEVGGLLGADIASQCATPILWNLLKTSNTGNCPDIYTTAQLKTMFLSMADSAMKRWWIASAGKSFLSFLIDNSGKYLWTNPINGVAGKSQFSTVALNALFFDDKNNLRITDPCQGGIVMQQNYNALKDIVTVVPVDPNDMYGPFGFGDKKWVAANPGANVLYNYRINFENDSTKATAPALVVKVVSKIDSCLDIRTLRLGNYGFYNRTFQTSSSGASSIPHLWQDLTQQAGIYVDVFAGVDQKNNEVFWTFTTVDPITKQVPSDPMKGFLPVNDKTNRGQGFVNFTVRAKSTIHTGQIANAVGNIIFDAEQPISTPPIYNTLDALAPVSKVQKLPAIIDSTDFWVSWGGQDDSLGSDINSYTIWVSENGGPFNTWLANVSNTSAVFNGTQGSTYRFYSTARDNAGNTEVKSIPDASIAVGTSRLTSQKIILNKGWNMMSSYILPQQLSLDSIFAKMVAKILLMKSSSGNLYMPGSGINTIKNWQYAEGYKIYISSPDSVIISGQYIKSDIVPVIMNKGWNIVSYLRDIRQNVDTSFSSLHGKLKLAKNNAGQIYWPEYSINTIGKLNPGEGYQLFNTDVDSLIYPMLSNDYKNVFAKETGNATAAQTTPHYKLNYTATGTNATLLFDNLAGFSNAEIGAWDKNNLIGTGTVTDNKCVLTLWGDNPESKDIIEGAQSGDEISFTLWDPRIGKERPMEIQHLRDVIADKDTTPKVLFAPNAIQIASAKVNPVIPGTYSLGQNYPNPFNPVTIITYSLPAEDQVTITVYNILGRRIKTLVNEKQKAGYYTIQYSGENTASGVYFYRLETQHYTETKKMLLLK
jgi:hypothetical protein